MAKPGPKTDDTEARDRRLEIRLSSAELAGIEAVRAARGDDYAADAIRALPTIWAERQSLMQAGTGLTCPTCAIHSAGMKPIMVRIPDPLLDRLDAVAERNGLDRSEVVRRFLAAGLEANPVPTEAELRAVSARRRGERAATGLVIPTPPLVAPIARGARK